MVKSLRIAIWAAVSSKPQVKKFSLQEQEAAGRRFAESFGAHVVAVYIVPGESRDLIFWSEAEEKIPAYRQLRQDCQAGAFDVLWALDPDRVGRDPALSSQVISLVEKSGAEVYLASAPHPIGKATVGHRYIYAIQSVRAKEDQSLRVKRHRFGTKGRIERGLPANHWPLGYLPIRDPDNGEVVGGELDPDLSPVVELATERFLAGDSYSQIVQALNRSSYHPPRTVRWSYSTVQKLLNNDTYAGYPSWGDFVASTKSECYPALWDEETFAAILQERKRRRRAPYGKLAGSPLSGVVFCARCGGGMTRHLSHYSDWWIRCNKHAKKSVTGAPCHANYLREDRVVAILADYLQQLQDDHVLEQALDERPTIDLEQRLSRTVTRLADLVQQRERLALALAAGKMDIQIYRQTDDYLLELIEALEVERLGLEATRASRPDIAERRRALAQLASIFPELIKSAPPTQVRALLQNAGVRIECEAGDVVFVGLVGGF